MNAKRGEGEGTGVDALFGAAIEMAHVSDLLTETRAELEKRSPCTCRCEADPEPCKRCDLLGRLRSLQESVDAAGKDLAKRTIEAARTPGGAH